MGDNYQVAPHAGAWIETYQYGLFSDLSHVAPHAGAWIETIRYGKGCLPISSHPTRVRGLKLCGFR